MNTNKVDWASEVQSAVVAMKEEGAKAYTYMKQEAPEVAAEYIRWRLFSDSVASGALLLLAISALAAASKCMKVRKETGDRDGNWIFGAVIAYILAAGLAFSSGACAVSATKCIIAPRIVILEGIKGVLR